MMKITIILVECFIFTGLHKPSTSNLHMLVNVRANVTHL